MNTRLPALTTEQMIEVDRLMIEKYQITLIQMMENAGRNLASLATRLLGSAANRQILVLCGRGNNGGGGLVSARHLSNWGAKVTVWLVGDEGTLTSVPAHQWRALQELPIIRKSSKGGERPTPDAFDLTIDALIGYGLKGNPRGEAAEIIRLVNANHKPTLSLDAPAGLDTTDGTPGDPCIRADATMTLALPKVGLLTEAAREVVGDLYLADISVPPGLYSRLGFTVADLFDKDTIIRLTVDGQPAA